MRVYPPARYVRDDHIPSTTPIRRPSPQVHIVVREPQSIYDSLSNREEKCPQGAKIPSALSCVGGLLKKAPRCFREQRYMEENVGGGEQMDGDGNQDEDGEAALDNSLGWKEIRLLSFALARGVAGLIIRRAQRRCQPEVVAQGWWRGGGRGGIGPNLDPGGRTLNVAERKGLGECNMGSLGRLLVGQERQEEGTTALAEHGGCAARSGESSGGGGLRTGHRADLRPANVSLGAGGPSQAISSQDLSVQDILAEWDHLSSPGPKHGVYTLEQSGASPEQAMVLPEEGAANLMGASRRVGQDRSLLAGCPAQGLQSHRLGVGGRGWQARVGGGRARSEGSNPVIPSPLGQPFGTRDVWWVEKLS
ncbi:hypothetical protein CYMTET_22308 [Cymbomonas tetramitiformis]|uniref:Uncharacterized protein n=1 Tax=Cymbomonas tetramitiformis TaxID=36881 RepID=A0AAE0G0H1_9CHLO|nr:hypothetical protein CYMTET_22308 [Cymbomonas tetramitiformis]